jgi:hypothetical protein
MRVKIETAGCSSAIDAFKGIIIGEVSGSRGCEFEGDFSGLLRRTVWYKLTDVSEVLAASIFRAVMSVDFCKVHNGTSQKIFSVSKQFGRRGVRIFVIGWEDNTKHNVMETESFSNDRRHLTDVSHDVAERSRGQWMLRWS